MSECIFCKPGTMVYVRQDGYPVSPGHLLIIPGQHYETYFDVPLEVRMALWNRVDDAKKAIEENWEQLQLPALPAGYNVGINCGEAAGQTVMHCHVHLIPRYDGDMEDPRGGVRGCIPERMNYKNGTLKYEPENGHF